MMGNTRQIRVAGVQMASRLGDLQANLARATALAEEAARQHAELILFPEVMPSGYTTHESLWESAEPSSGPSVQWILETAARLRVYLGTSFIEAAEGHIYNSFVLGAPDGSEAGRVRKSHAETYLFRSEPGPHVIATALGRIGVGICADNQYADLPGLLRHHQADLLLMPHAWSVPWRSSKVVSEEDLRDHQARAGRLGAYYAEMLGIPTVFVNHVGPSSHLKGQGFIGTMLDSEDYFFPGLSSIHDGDGQVLVQLGAEEGIAVATVTLDPARRTSGPTPRYGQWATPGSPSRGLVVALDGGFGSLSYWFSARRRQFARAHSRQ